MTNKVRSGNYAINASATPAAKGAKRIDEPSVQKNVPLTHGDKHFIPSKSVYLGDPNTSDHFVLTIHKQHDAKEKIEDWPAVLSLRTDHLPEQLSLDTKHHTPAKGRRWIPLSDMPIPDWKTCTADERSILMCKLGKKKVSAAYGEHHREHDGVLGKVGDYLKGTATATVSASTVLFLATRLREKHAKVANAQRISFEMFSLARSEILRDLSDLSASRCVSGATIGSLLARSVEPIVNPPLTGKEGQVALLLASNVAEHIAALKGDPTKCADLLVRLSGDGFIQQVTDSTKRESSPANAGARVGIALTAAFIAAEKQGADHEKKKLYVKLGFIAAQKLLEACPFISAAGIVLDVAEAIVDYQMDKTGNDVSKTAMAAMANCVFIPAEKINAQPHNASPDAWSQQDLSIFFRWVKHVVNAAGYAC